MINLTENAINKLKEILSEDPNPNLKLRVFVHGGGCSGMQYGFTLDEISNEDDHQLDFSGVPVLVDSISIQYLEQASVDFVEDITGSNFIIKNPQAVTTCGCGASFSPY